MKQIIMQPKGKIVAFWHFAHNDCDCYGFINHKTHELQWEPTTMCVSGAQSVTALNAAKHIKETWPDHTIVQVLID